MSVKDFMEQFEAKVNKPTLEETHKRMTFMFERELLERLDRISRGQPRGFKTAFVNEALRRLLDEFEGDK